MSELEQNRSINDGYRDREQLANPAEVLQQSCERLDKYGGFELIGTSIDGLQNLNPEKKARKKIFLTDNEKKKERENLIQSLQLWYGLIADTNTVADMATKAEQQSEEASILLKKNLATAIHETKNLERSYRSVDMFFNNAESDKIKNLSILNASPDQLKDLDSPEYIDAVAEELRDNYDRLDLRRNYSILVVPGYLGSPRVIDKWAKIAHENKVMMVTDFLHLDEPDDVMEMFEEADLTSGDDYKSNVMMTCNWLVGRGKYNTLDEDEDLYLPPSTALAGRVYQTLMSQVTAGKRHGTLCEVDGVRFDLKKTEIASLEKMGLIPMVNEYGKVMAFSAKTLFNGDNLGLQTYSVVRVFDYITKVLIDFLNRRAFENFTSNTKKDLQSQIVKFLDNITGPKSLIENFTIKRFEQDPTKKDRIYLDIHITPYFPAKNFIIKLDGQKGDSAEATTWQSNYNQQA